MSHSFGRVKCADGTLYWVEYNGTVDVLCSNLFKTVEDCREYWRGAMWRKCENKEHIHEDAEVAVTYGGGYYWPVKICRECMCVTDNFVPHDDNEQYYAKDGLPDWYPDRELYER